MNKSSAAPPQYGFVAPPQAPPSYQEAVGGVLPSSPFTPNQKLPDGTTIVTTVVPIGMNATHMICPHCHAEINTATKKEPALIAYISGLLIALVGCVWGCCLIPCCIDECMDVHHSCPNCRAYLGKFRR
jgi:hypothetical protein